MNPSLDLDVEALARMRLRLGREAKSLRPVGFRLDSDGIDIAVTLPGPDYLAAILTLGEELDLYRVGTAGLVARPSGSTEEPAPMSVVDLVDALRAALRALPARPDAGEVYGDLRLAARTRSARFEEYVRDVVRAYVRTLPSRGAVTRPKAPRPPAMTPLERKHAERARRRSEERASARWALALFLDEEAPEPGARVPGSTVFDFASEVLGYAVERYAETVVDPDPRELDLFRASRAERLAVWDEVRSEEWEDPPPPRPRTVSRRVLFEVASGLGAFRVTRPKGSVALTVVRRFIHRLKESTVNALRRAFEVLGTGPADPEEYADEAAREVLALAPTVRPEALDTRVLSLPVNVAFAVVGVPDSEAVRMFGRAARLHLDRHPTDRDAVAAVAAALRAGDPDGLVAQIRVRCADALRAEGVAA